MPSISIHTNLSSLIAQQSLKQSSNKLNLAVERMSTGFKINHAKDNAANYSISTNMTTKIGAYQVAEDNVAMGLDLLSTANGSLDQISDKLSRLRALAEQSANGTYGAQSKQAINAEANALVDEIERLYNTTEYNGINLFNKEKAPTFINEVIKRDTSLMTALASVDENTALAVGTYSISTAAELVKLGEMSDKGLISYGTEVVLASDIDLSAYSTGEGWEPISCRASIDGNGYVIKNLYINRMGVEDQALFSKVASVMNLGLENVSVTSEYTAAGLTAITDDEISNCYVTGTITGGEHTGGLVGIVEKHGAIEYSFTTCDINGSNYVGGLAGTLDDLDGDHTINSCYTTGEIRGRDWVGGLCGSSSNDIISCYSTSNIYGNDYVGGLCAGTGFFHNSYSTGNISGRNYIGGIAGGYDPYYYSYDSSFKNVYSSGTISGNNNVGGLSGGCAYVMNSYVLGISPELDQIFTAESNETNVIEDSFYNPCYDDFGITQVVLETPWDPGFYNVTNVQTYDGEAPFKYHKDFEPYRFSMQVGINSNESSQIAIESGFSIDKLKSLRFIGKTSNNHLRNIDAIIAEVSANGVSYGAAQNRLESALDEISTQYENLVSSRSTLRDADISEVSSEYIRQQILQEASATLLSTANQNPSIALQLL